MLTIAKSPLRVSLFGGGTDYPAYFKNYPGAVLGTAINKHIHIVTLPMVGYAENRFRITYRIVEAVDRVADIKHNVIRATLQETGFDEPLNIAIISDLPGNSGLGSSSSFTVGFVKLIEHLRGRHITKLDLMKEAVRIEHDVLGENVGIQDQTHASFGGLNLYRFHEDQFSIQPIRMTTDCRDALNKSLCLIYTGRQRSASTTVDEQVRNTRERKIESELKHLLDLCSEGARVLEGKDPDSMLRELGSLVSDGWETKRKLSSAVTTPEVDAIYDAGMAAGAHGGKLCGAGGGGFFLFLASPATQVQFRSLFGAENVIDIEMEDNGAQIIASPSSPTVRMPVIG